MIHLEVQNLTKQYSNHLALDNLSLSIPKQSIFGLLGPNGAGKTSLIRIITQILDATSGNVFFNGERLKQKHLNAIGYLPEERGLYRKMYVREHLEYIASLREINKADATKTINDWIKRFDLTKWEKAEVGSLSKGMQQKVQFITTVLHDPELIILDEPFSGFDPVNQQLLTDEIIRLNKEGKTIIFSTHRMESVEEICTHIALIHKSNCVLKGEIGDIRQKHSTNNSIIKVSENSIQEEIITKTENVKNTITSLNPKAQILSVEQENLSIKDLFISLVNESN